MYGVFTYMYPQKYPNAGIKDCRSSLQANYFEDHPGIVSS